VRKNSLDKDTMDKLKKSMKEIEAAPGFVRGRALVEPKTKTDLIKKRLCTKLIEYHQSHRQIKQDELAKKLEINQSTLSFILNYHLDKVSIDTLLKSLEKISDEDSSINETLKRIALA
jgi:predicted XRE-type DNA-binding protein